MDSRQDTLTSIFCLDSAMQARTLMAAIDPLNEPARDDFELNALKMALSIVKNIACDKMMG